jgi:hypothetical protein
LAAGGRIDEIYRQGVVSSRAFVRGLRELRQLQAERRELAREDLTLPDPRFALEAACSAYLAARFKRGPASCHRCGVAGKGSWIAARGCWECGNCGAQTGLHSGTVMERSPLPLTVWFHAVRCLLLRPTIGTSELAAILNISRLPTVRNLALRIRSALGSEEVSPRLAGLDLVYLGQPEPSARARQNFPRGRGDNHRGRGRRNSQAKPLIRDPGASAGDPRAT